MVLLGTQGMTQKADGDCDGEATEVANLAALSYGEDEVARDDLELVIHAKRRRLWLYRVVWTSDTRAMSSTSGSSYVAHHDRIAAATHAQAVNQRRTRLQWAAMAARRDGAAYGNAVNVWCEYLDGYVCEVYTVRRLRGAVWLTRLGRRCDEETHADNYICFVYISSTAVYYMLFGCLASTLLLFARCG